MDTFICDTWNEFRDFADQESLLPYYWRGQRDPMWPLASSFERLVLARNGGTENGASQLYPYDHRYGQAGNRHFQPGVIQWLRNFYLSDFKTQASGLRGPNPKTLTEDEWWALGRHYGLITLLLDWTLLPYVAVFFALADFLTHAGTFQVDDSTSSPIAIYRLRDNNDLEGNGLKVVKVILDEVGSIQGQHALFTQLESDEFFELQGFLENNGKEQFLTQILLPTKTFQHAYVDLIAHGINYRTIFPDLRGAALAANMSRSIAVDMNYPR